MEEGYFEIDRQGILAFVNQAFCRMTGRTADQLVGKSHRDCAGRKSADLLEQAFEQIVVTGESQHIERYEIISAKETPVTVELSVSLIPDKGDEACGFRVLGRDISARRRVEAEKSRQAVHLQQARKMEAVGTLASGIAHEFNNIMMGIMGNASLMRSRIDRDHPHYEKLQTIEKYIHNGSELTQQLLGFARGGKYNV